MRQRPSKNTVFGAVESWQSAAYRGATRGVVMVMIRCQTIIAINTHKKSRKVSPAALNEFNLT
jgi:hypothetical protein